MTFTDDLKQAIQNKLVLLSDKKNDFTGIITSTDASYPTRYAVKSVMEEKKKLHFGDKVFQLVTGDKGKDRISLEYKGGILDKVYIDNVAIYTNSGTTADWSIVFKGTNFSTTVAPFSNTEVTKIIYDQDHIVDYDNNPLTHTYTTDEEHSIGFVGKATTLAEESFKDNTNLIYAYLPDTLTTIPNKVFYGCTGLKRMEFNEGLTTIGEYAFEYCNNLETINLPSTLTTIQKGGFYGCVKLIDVVLNEGLTSLGESAFSYCSNLTSVTFPSTLTTTNIGTFQGCTNLKDLTFAEGIETIESNCFSNCTNLAELNLPNSVKLIANNSFQFCTSLTEVILPEGLEEMYGWCFRNCTGLKKVVLPSTLTAIGMSCFDRCNNLKDVTFKSTTPPSLASKSFGTNPSGMTITVPAGTLDAYKSASGYPNPATNTYKEAEP